ncbi:MAG: efflux RND transporter periplasmic adaptor subunit [Phycisphaerae bacterium]|nr:efflux RND transporter periplasmic adaptor subunit [Phycisphaerae bacterium]
MKRRFVLLFLGHCTALGLWGCEQPPPDKPVRPVKAMKVGDITVFAGRKFPGRAKATEEVNLSFRVSGPLIALPVKVGDQAKKGDVLAKIDPRDFEVQLLSSQAELAKATAQLEAMSAGARPEEIEQLKAALQSAEAVMKRWQKEYDRIMDLDKKGAAATIEVTRTIEERDSAEAKLRHVRENLRIGQTGARKEDIDAKKAEIKSLEAAVDAAKDQLAYTTLKAPFEGTIAVKYVENFQTVQAKEPIVRLLDTSKIEMVVDIPEGLISYAKYATEAICRFEALPDREFKAKIKEIGAEASETTRTYPVTLIMDQPKDAKILPGMSGTAQGKGKLPDDVAVAGFEVPVTAIVSDKDGKKSVWVIDEKTKTVKRREVKPGKLSATGMLVQGLQSGEWIAIAGAHYLEDGQEVRLLTDEAGEVSQ